MSQVKAAMGLEVSHEYREFNEECWGQGGGSLCDIRGSADVWGTQLLPVIFHQTEPLFTPNLKYIAPVILIRD